MLMRSVLFVLLLSLGMSDAFARDLATNWDPAQGARRGRGVVVISMTMPTHEIDAHWARSNFNLTYNAVGNLWPNSAYMPRDNEYRSDVASEFPDVYGQLRVFDVRAGDYELSGFTYIGYREGNAISYWTASLMAPLRFTVRPGRVTYLGRVHMDEALTLPDAPPANSYFAWPRFIDERSQDLALLSSRYPAFTADLVDIASNDAAAWTQAWKREMLCLPWTRAGLSGVRAIQEGGAFAWERDFRELALALAACDNVNGDEPRGFFNISRNLQGADVRWQGVVRAISVGNGNIALTLDTQTDDVRVKVYTSYFAPAEATGITCCVVTGEFESWRAVQVGDTIAVHGQIDDTTALQFNGERGQAATQPVMPIVRNARAEVLSRAAP